MPIYVECPGCDAKFQAPEKLAGKRLKCPKCSAVVTVGERSQRPSGQAAPAEEETPLIPAACLCGKKLRVKAELAGRRVKCPACGQVLTVPDAGPASAQPAGELDLGQLPGVDEAAATTLGAPLPQATKKERPANTRLIVGLSAGVGAAVLVLLLVLVLWPSGEDKELAKKDGASSESSTEAADTSAAVTDEELIDSQVLAQAATELFAQSVARAKETGQPVPPGDVATELKKIHPAVLRITKDQESRLAAGQFDDQANSDRLQTVLNQWSGADSYLKGSHPPGLKYLVQQFQSGKLHGAHLKVAQRLLDAEFVAYSQALGGSSRPLSQEEPRAGGSGPRTYPSFPDALTEPPAWIGSDAPFDVAKFLQVPPPQQNAAPLYLDAMFEFSGEFSICFTPAGAKPQGEVLRRVETARRRIDEYVRLEEAWEKNPKTVDEAAVDAWLAQYETGFQKLAEAQRRPQCVFETGVGIAALMPHTQARQVVRVVKWRARRDLAKGNIDRPIQDVELVLRLSRDIQPRGGVICQLVSVAVDDLCCGEIITQILRADGIEQAHCDHLMAELTRHETVSQRRFAEGMQMEYLVARKSFHDFQHHTGDFSPQGMKNMGWRGRADTPLARLRLLTNLSVGRIGRLAEEKYGKGAAGLTPDHPLVTGWTHNGKLLSDADYAKEVSELNSVYASILSTADQPAMERLQASTDAAIIEPLRDTKLALLFEPSVAQNWQKALLRADATLRGTRCLIALRRWQIDHDGPPPDLETIVKAAGMQSIPADPYTGRPMQMTTVNGEPVIYSVAMDGKDDGGRIDVWKSSQRGKLGDLLFRLNASQ